MLQSIRRSARDPTEPLVHSTGHTTNTKRTQRSSTTTTTAAAYENTTEASVQRLLSFRLPLCPKHKKRLNIHINNKWSLHFRTEWHDMPQHVSKIQSRSNFVESLSWNGMLVLVRCNSSVAYKRGTHLFFFLPSLGSLATGFAFRTALREQNTRDFEDFEILGEFHPTILGISAGGSLFPNFPLATPLSPSPPAPGTACSRQGQGELRQFAELRSLTQSKRSSNQSIVLLLV